MYKWKGIALIEDDQYFTKWVKETGKLDHHDGFLRAIQPYLKGTMLDIGANVGTHTFFYQKFGDVLAFEPNPIAFECLQYNCPNVECYNVAVGDKLGTISMSPVDDGNYGAAYTRPGQDIHVITIDSLKLDACDYIKIDVEGDEVAVLEGGRETIMKYRPTMVIESNPGTLDRKGKCVADLLQMIELLDYTRETRSPLDISCDIICHPN